AEQWVAYATFELQHNELYRLEQIFNKSLLSVPDVRLWGIYLDYVRRRNNLTTDASGQARSVITSAYDFALQQVGIDKDSAPVWTDYVQIIRSGPGLIGNSTWQDQQKMDMLRKAYQRAINVPMAAVTTMWKEYGDFENGLNRLTGKKYLQDRSNGYMTARSCFLQVQRLTEGLRRTTVPRLPPLPGCEGYEDFQRQLAIWRAWCRWETEDPLALKEEGDLAGYRARVTYVYKQALMAMRFVPELYLEAATFCYEHALDAQGDEFLKQGIEANPESTLLAFKRADRLELTSADEHDAKRRGALVREPYDRVLDALYEHMAKARGSSS
ncbi:mRNA 3'-end-processing protein rna14, partial [Ascosphaera acerosa]